MPLLVLLLFLLPFVEIYLLIKVGSIIGILPTIALVVGLSVFGAYLIWHQGLAALFKAQGALSRGEMPMEAMLDGVGLTVAGALLLAPGFITEAAGFALLVPAVRRWVMRWSVHWLLARHVFGGKAQQAPQPEPPRRKPSPGPAKAPPGGVIDGEFHRLDE